MGRLTNLNPPTPIADADLPASIARDAEFIAADLAHVNAVDPHLQYPTQARGDARYVRKFSQYFRAAPSVSQPLSQNTVTKVTFNTVTSNIGNQYSPTNHRITAIENEIWRITTAIEFNLPTSSRFRLWLAKNSGSNVIQLLDLTAVGFSGMTITAADQTLLAGEFLEVWARILNIPNGSIYGDSTLDICWWEGSRVG
jgi:hypothetical protein